MRSWVGFCWIVLAVGCAGASPGAREAVPLSCDGETAPAGCFPRSYPVDPCSGAERDPATEPPPRQACVCDLCRTDADCDAGGRCQMLRPADDVCAPARRICVKPSTACLEDRCDREAGEQCLYRGTEGVCARPPAPPP